MPGLMIWTPWHFITVAIGGWMDRQHDRVLLQAAHDEADSRKYMAQATREDTT